MGTNDHPRGLGLVGPVSRYVPTQRAVKQFLLALRPLLISVCLLVLAYWAMDRRPPYKLLYIDPAVGAPGEKLIFRSYVWRDRSRDCSATMTRYLIDPTGVVKVMETYTASDTFIDLEEKEHPGIALAAVEVPRWWPAGPSVMRTVLTYRCNITHVFAPIEITVDRPFLVSAPKNPTPG